MDTNTFYKILGVVIIALAATIPALVVINVLRKGTKKRHLDTSGMDMNIRGVKLPKDKKKKKRNLGSSAGRW